MKIKYVLQLVFAVFSKFAKYICVNFKLKLCQIQIKIHPSVQFLREHLFGHSQFTKIFPYYLFRTLLFRSVRLIIHYFVYVIFFSCY